MGCWRAVKGAVTGVNPVTSIGFGFADPSAGLRSLSALHRDWLANRSACARLLGCETRAGARGEGARPWAIGRRRCARLSTRGLG